MDNLRQFNLRQFIINKTHMRDNDFYDGLRDTHIYLRIIMNDFEKELNGEQRTENLDYIYDRLNIEVKRFENVYKVKYNYELDKLKNID